MSNFYSTKSVTCAYFAKVKINAMRKGNGGVAGKSENSLVQVFERTVSKAVEVFLLGSIFTLTSFTGPRRINLTPDKGIKYVCYCTS